MPGVSVHVVDVSRGVSCTGMQVSIYALDTGGGLSLIAEGAIGRNGLLEAPALSQTFPAGRYRAVFQIGRYYRDAGVTLARVPFLDAVNYDFGIDDPQQHYHLPFKCTPWGFSCFRGA